MMVGNGREVWISPAMKEMPGRLKAEALQTSLSCKDAFSLGSLDSVLIL